MPVEKLQYAPRQGVRFEAPIDVWVPALSRLRACRDSIDVLMLCDSIPEMLIPGLAHLASQRAYIEPFAVKTLIRYCGPRFLEACLGKPLARQLQSRLPN